MVSLVYSCVASYVVHIRAMGETSSKRKLAALQRSKFHFQTLVTDLYQDTFHFYLEKKRFRSKHWKYFINELMKTHRVMVSFAPLTNDKSVMIELNEHETDPYFLQLSQN